MNQNIKENIHHSKISKCTDKSFMKQKEYNTPSITTIGQVNKITLNGLDIPVNDSGANFTAS